MNSPYNQMILSTLPPQYKTQRNSTSKGIKHKSKWSSELRQQVMDKVKEGKGYADVAKEMKVPYHRVITWCSHEQIASPTHVHHSPDIIESVVEKVKEGGSYAETARTMGVCPTSVRGWCQQVEVTSPKGKNVITEEDRLQAMQWIKEEKMSVESIAMQMGVVPGTIVSWCRKYQVDVPPGSYGRHRKGKRGVSEQDRERAIALVQSGHSYVAAGRVIGVSGVTVLKWCHNRNITSVIKAKWTKEMRDQVVEMAKTGILKCKIAQKTKVSKGCIERWTKDMVKNPNLL
jgi:transposase-like protein